MSQTLVDAMREKIAFLEKNPQFAKAVFKASAELVGGTQVDAKVRQHPPMRIDEPPELGGTDTGPNPVELLLVSLGSCQEIVYSLYALMMGIELESVVVEVKGHLDVRGLFGIGEGVPPGFQKISYETRIASKASPEMIERLVKTVETHCPSLDTLKRPIEVGGTVVLNGQPLKATAEPA
jgi:uncharacterized OsmC-like protein